ncbi:hypothetical protein HMPREF3209_02217 [Lactobacillus crispatus]|nr:hypothetical protein HMPREF3209_02217 [Lactobacillus crispatus]
MHEQEEYLERLLTSTSSNAWIELSLISKLSNADSDINNTS